MVEIKIYKKGKIRGICEMKEKKLCEPIVALYHSLITTIYIIVITPLIKKKHRCLSKKNRKVPPCDSKLGFYFFIFSDNLNFSQQDG